MPLTVVDAVLARVHRLDPATQAALEQLSVVPGRVELPLARALLGDLTVLAPAERRGVLEVRPDAVAFRHELARRAVAGFAADQRADAAQRQGARGAAAPRRLDLSRIVHHGVEAGDDAVIAEYGRRPQRRRPPPARTPRRSCSTKGCWPAGSCWTCPPRPRCCRR